MVKEEGTETIQTEEEEEGTETYDELLSKILN